MAREQNGFTLVEALLAMFIVAVVATSVMSAYNVMLSTNSRNELRSAAVVAAEEVLEATRMSDPSGLPDTGSTTTPTIVVVGNRSYSVHTRYCVDSSMCTDNARHLTVEVSFNSEVIYSVETVFTKLR